MCLLRGTDWVFMYNFGSVRYLTRHTSLSVGRSLTITAHTAVKLQNNIPANDQSRLKRERKEFSIVEVL